MWAGLIALSSLVSKRVHLEMGHFDIYTNLYVVFVAPPGGRKSTAMDFTGRFLEEAKGIPIALDCVTKEAIIGAMQTCEMAFTPPQGGLPFVYTPMTILATELSEFIGASKEGMINFLTTLFDKRGDYTYRTIKRGAETIIKPYLTMLGCTTPAWITARLRDDIISGGYSRRAIFVYESEEAARIAFPEVTDEMRLAWDEAMAYAQELKKVFGIFRWEDDAKLYFKNWYDAFVPPTKDPMLLGYFRTKHVQLLKVAQLISLSESTALVLRKDHLEFAMGLLNMVEQNLSRVFEGVGRNELNGMASTLFDLIRAAGGHLAEKKAYVAMFAHGNEAEVRQVVDHLVNSDKLVRQPLQHKTKNITTMVLFTKEAHLKLKQEQEFLKSQNSSN